MSFCVECGTEGPTIEGLCARHFVKKYELVKAPDRILVERCAHCGKLELPRGWSRIAVEDSIPALLAANTVRDSHVEGVQFTWVSREEGPTRLALTVKAQCRVGEWDLVSSFRTTLLVRTAVCPTCSKQSGRYFTGTVQVRAEGRPLSDEERRLAERMVDDAKTGEAEFVSKVEPAHGGIDVRVSTNAFAKRLARDLAKEFAGTIGTSATLHTRREGREVYRTTYIVRIPTYRQGDTIQWRGERYHVEALGDPVRLRHVDSGAIARVRMRDLRSAKPAADEPRTPAAPPA